MENEQNVFTELGLTITQTEIMYNLERQKTQSDIDAEKNPENLALKKLWIKKWEKEISTAFVEQFNDTSLRWLEERELSKVISDEISLSPNKMWLHLAVLETALFTPYYALEYETKKISEKEKTIPTKESKAFQKLKYKAKNAWLKNYLIQSKFIKSDFVERVEKCYKKANDRLTGKAQKLVILVLANVAAAAIIAATAGLFAGPIAVMLVGSNFPTLTGAALTNACLALLGGGAIAIGGAGMAGGTAAIVGGGALLGLGVTSTISGAAATIGIFTNKQTAISQAAKLEVTMKEIILNTQGDVNFAQEVLKSYKENIKKLKDRLGDLELNQEEDKKAIKSLKEVIEILEKSYKYNQKFASAYEIGITTEA